MKEQPDSLLKNRNFMLLWSGQLVSWVGTEITNIALPLIVLAITGSTFQAGSIAAIRGAVYALWAIPAGALIDRWNRKTVMVIANLGSGLAMGSIYVASVITFRPLAIDVNDRCLISRQVSHSTLSPLSLCVDR